jgi:hypothetical protein
MVFIFVGFIIPSNSINNWATNNPFKLVSKQFTDFITVALHGARNTSYSTQIWGLTGLRVNS